MNHISNKIKYFNNVPAVPRREMILSRLGYRSGLTHLNINDEKLIDECISFGSCLCKPSGAYLILSVVSRNEHSIMLENNICFESSSLLKLLKDSDEVLLMASTVGREVIDRIIAEVQNGNAAKGLLIDSVASQTADAVLDWMVGLIGKMLERQGKKLTKHRYSPGFGDLPLEYQKDIFNALELEKFNMNLTEKFMLIPEKSVIAIAGIEKREFKQL